MPHVCKQEVRIAAIESKTALATNDIKHLVVRLDKLTNVLYSLAVVIGGCMLSAFGALITYWVKGA